MQQPISTAADPSAPAGFASQTSAEFASQTPGTLMWVGDRRRAEFREAYAYCEQHAAQLASRRDLAEALARPAAAVERVVIARPTRLEPARQLQQELAAQYPSASVVHLLGPLCAGESPSQLEPLGTSRFYWHQANQVLPKWLGASQRDAVSADSPRRSVAVIAATESAAEPLLDLAASAGATAVWCRRADRFRIRNVDLVWWDDSAAPAVPVETWRQRLATVSAAAPAWRIGGEVAPGAPAQQVRHAWLVGGPTLRQCRQAGEAGVQTILTKPAQIGPLLSMISRASCGDAAGRRDPIPPTAELTIGAGGASATWAA